MNKSLIDCQNVTLSFADRMVIHDFNLSLQGGDRIAFLGPSGCGKSTLLNLISGLLTPTSGHIERRVSIDKISFVFQDASLIPWKTVRGNLLLMNELQSSASVPTAEINQRAESLLKQVGLAERIDAYPDELSGGMKMRVALARALLNSPQLLLLDEPFAALDDLTRERLQDDLLNLQAEHASSFVLVTHNIEEALLLCNRILVFSPSGKVIKEYSFQNSASGASARLNRDAGEIQALRREIRLMWNSEPSGVQNHA